MLRDITANAYEFQDPNFDNSRYYNLPITNAAMLGSLRTERILQNNKK